MDFGVTSKRDGYAAAQRRQSASVGKKNAGAIFAKLVAEKTAGQTNASGAAVHRSDMRYMGETYQERLQKITNPDAAVAFQAAYAKKLAGATDAASVLSKLFSAGKTGAATFAEAFPAYRVVTHVGNADIAAANWQRNDFPFWEYYRENTSADALNDWRPSGPNPPQTRSDLQRNYSSIGPGRMAVLVPEKLQAKMDADPAYARQIMAKLQEWKEDYDRWDNTVAASYGYDVAAHQAGKSYVFDLDENGDVRNCTVTGSGGTLTGPTKEEREQFEAEQKRKWKLRVKYIEIMEESARKRNQMEREDREAAAQEARGI